MSTLPYWWHGELLPSPEGHIFPSPEGHIFNFGAALSHAALLSVDALTTSRADVAVTFNTCDICLDLAASVNAGLAATLSAVTLFLFTFVCIENTASMLSSNYVFLARLFAAAAPGATFVFTDTSHRLWAEIARHGGEEFLSFVLFLRGSNPKHALLMIKRCGAVESLRNIAEKSTNSNSAGEMCLFMNDCGVDGDVDQFVEVASQCLRANCKMNHTSSAT